jgi:hypothetical protein
VTSQSPKITQAPPPPPASSDAPLLDADTCSITFPVFWKVPANISLPQPLALSPARIQEDPEERVQAVPRIQGSNPQIVPEMLRIGETQ